MKELYRTFRGHRIVITASRRHFFDCDVQGRELWGWFSFPKIGNDADTVLQEAMLKMADSIFAAKNRPNAPALCLLP